MHHHYPLHSKHQLIAMLCRCWTGSLCSEHFCSETTLCVCLPLWFGEMSRPVWSNWSITVHSRTAFFHLIFVQLCFLKPVLSIASWPLVLVMKVLHLCACMHSELPLTNRFLSFIWALLWMPCSVALSPAKQSSPTCSTLKTDWRQNLQRSFKTKLNRELSVCVGL